MPVNPTPCCLYYWDGKNWSGPLASSNCGTCNKTSPPDPPPSQPGFVPVDCPGYKHGGKKKEDYFVLHLPPHWRAHICRCPVE